MFVEIAQRSVVVALSRFGSLLNGEFKQFQRFGKLAFLVDPASLLEVVEFEGNGGVDAAEVVVGLLLELLAEAAADGGALDFEQLALVVGRFLLVAGGEGHVLLGIAGAVAVVLVVLVETEVSALLLHLFVSVVADPDFSQVQVLNMVRLVLEFLLLGLVLPGGEGDVVLVGVFLEGGVLGFLFENLLSLVDLFEAGFVVAEGEGAVEGVPLGLGGDRQVSAIIMGHRSGNYIV